jgi:hypothetical protein
MLIRIILVAFLLNIAIVASQKTFFSDVKKEGKKLLFKQPIVIFELSLQVFLVSIYNSAVNLF